MVVKKVTANERMHCMEVFGGSQLTERAVKFGGLDTWLFSKPHGEARDGGDVYYASSCINGRISRFLVADIAGHGEAAAATALESRYPGACVAEPVLADFGFPLFV